MFIPVLNYHFQQMVYYYLVNKGCVPYVHIFEEGASTYVDNQNPSEYKAIQHQLYKESVRFPANTTNVFLYLPSLYSGKGNMQLIPIQQMPCADSSFFEQMYYVFGKPVIPNERYLFFNECFSEDYRISNEIEILDAIAAIVGKDNISVKMHPRSIKLKELYQLHGYHLFPEKSSMWEVAALSPEIKDKVLISISSNTIWTPLVVAGLNCKVISLANLMRLSKRPHVQVPAYRSFLGKVKELANANGETFFYVPDSYRELYDIISYLEGEMQ